MNIYHLDNGFSLACSTLADTHVAGYDIPAGTLVMANFWAVHHDPRHWKDPESFKPERFLTSDGKSVVKSPHYMPFSIGKVITIQTLCLHCSSHLDYKLERNLAHMFRSTSSKD
ncbi:hypothetical protein AVEN_250222-1 [Araneus ventricosus]|uniref:Uncharacterized protein n=1 Tax=Araneus ventricosus TaxID=182803 RepID=A0A4Y2FFA2_ARAVE|nr:hypothetical protein AVEN_250222-1 [Araneus ventricosus]